VTLVLDAGALLALERGDREMWRRLEVERRSGAAPVTHGGVVAQVWRGGSGRQVVLARALVGVDVLPLDDDLGRRSGLLLAHAGTADAIDAAVALLAADDDRIATSDPDDLIRLVRASGRHVDVITV
jgi:hypothetical protein